MDAVSGVASISQLFVYGHSVTKSLIRLYKAVQNGPAAFRDQKFNVSLLLEITKRVSQRTSSENETILLLFVQITESVHSIINLLEQRGILGINWVSFTKNEALTVAFESLGRKRDLLQLHISQEGLEILNRIQSDIASMSRRIESPSTGEEGAGTRTSSNAEVESKGDITSMGSSANDKRKRSDPKVRETKQASTPSGSIRLQAQGNECGDKSIQNIANGWGVVAGPGANVDLNTSENKSGVESKQNIGNHSQDDSAPKH
ncbi:hypothetical protein N431DRAFT_564386 [Stipitochalara longipes BDJ]|nr:hypothetical protein N431DRAFT_564386 [Stipitochalara longipes BDJ]